jgi:hypothetical protein
LYILSLLSLKEVRHNSTWLDCLHQMIWLHFGMLSLSKLNCGIGKVRTERHPLSLQIFHLRLLYELLLSLELDSINIEKLKFFD